VWCADLRHEENKIRAQYIPHVVRTDFLVLSTYLGVYIADCSKAPLLEMSTVQV
jgi:hypothetical protein